VWAGDHIPRTLLRTIRHPVIAFHRALLSIPFTRPGPPGDPDYGESLWASVLRPQVLVAP